jgi:hypothetical protein
LDEAELTATPLRPSGSSFLSGAAGVFAGAVVFRMFYFNDYANSQQTGSSLVVAGFYALVRLGGPTRTKLLIKNDRREVDDMMTSRIAIGTTVVVVTVVIVIMIATVGLVVLNSTITPASSATPSTTSTTTPTASASGPQPSILWSKAMGFVSNVTIYSQDDDGITVVAVSQNDSEVVVGTGQAIGNGSIYAFNGKGASLWNYTLNQFVSSISVSANGSLIAVGGFESAHNAAGTYENGAVHLLNGQGKLLWSEMLGGSGPSVRLSSDGSRLAVATDTRILYMNDKGQTLWSFNSGNSGNIVGMDMSPNGSNVVVSVMYSPNTQNWSWSFLSFSGGGKLLWNYTSISPGGVSFADRVVLAPDGSHTWASSEVSGENGTLYLFDNNGTLLWSRQIYSPALVIQTSSASQSVAVLTNRSTLVFNEEGQQLANYTVSQQSATSTPAAGSSCVAPSFWVSNLGSLNVLFLNGQGSPLSSYPLDRTVSNAVVSPDGYYAAIISNQGNRSILYFMDLVRNGSNCPAN